MAQIVQNTTCYLWKRGRLIGLHKRGKDTYFLCLAVAKSKVAERRKGRKGGRGASDGSGGRGKNIGMESKGVTLKPVVYAYKMVARFADGRTEIRYGDVTLMR